jgi:choice-of-anchor A domain-containing protein
VEGSILAGRDVAEPYSVNDKNFDAYGSYSLIAGGNLSFTSGSIKNGYTYVGGSANVTQSVDVAAKIQTGAAMHRPI